MAGLCCWTLVIFIISFCPVGTEMVGSFKLAGALQPPGLSVEHDLAPEDPVKEGSWNIFHLGVQENNAHPSNECLNLSTRFVYEQNLCSASSTQLYRVQASARARYTCAGRCGSPPMYGTPLTECACDHSCVAYRDCCDDMTSICPDILVQGRVAFSHLDKAESLCRDTSFQVFVKHKHYQTSTTASISLTRGVDEVASNSILSADSSDSPDLKSRFLLNYSDTFKVADLSHGLIFYNKHSYNMLSLITSRPHLLPKISFLDCVQEDGFSYFGNFSAVQVLNSCRVNAVTDVQTEFHRSCPVEEDFTCRCKNGKTFKDRIHSACMGYNVSETLEVESSPTKDRLYKMRGPEGAKIDIGEKCDTIIPEIKQSRGDVLMSITPYFAFLDETPAAGSRKLGTKGSPPTHTAGWSENLEDQDRSNLVRETDLEYFIEFTNTPERRYRCSSITAPLSRCELLECQAGSLMTESAGVTSQMGSFSCVLPALAQARRVSSSKAVPLCTCMRISAALHMLGYWYVRMQPRVKQTCWLTLIPSPANAKFHLPKVFKLEEAEMDGVRGVLYPFAPALTKTRLKSQFQITLNRTSEACTDDVDLSDLDICLYTAEELSIQSPEAFLCFRASAMAVVVQNLGWHFLLMTLFNFAI